jgi:hypothetical protein
LLPIFSNFGIQDENELPIWEKSFLREKLLPIEGNLFHTVDPARSGSEWEPNPPGSQKEARFQRVDAIRGSRRESIRSGEQDSGGSSQEREHSQWLTDSGFW